MYVTLWKFSNSPPNSVPVYVTITFIMMLHNTYNGRFYWVIFVIGLLDFGQRENYSHALLCASGSEI